MKRETMRSLEALLYEACETARNCKLSEAELIRYTREYACDIAGHLRDSIMVALEDHDHLHGIKAEHAAGDCANRLIAGPAPSAKHLLCACNQAWVPSEKRGSRTKDGKRHGYDDCG